MINITLLVEELLIAETSHDITKSNASNDIFNPRTVSKYTGKYVVNDIDITTKLR